MPKFAASKRWAVTVILEYDPERVLYVLRRLRPLFGRDGTVTTPAGWWQNHWTDSPRAKAVVLVLQREIPDIPELVDRLLDYLEESYDMALDWCYGSPKGVDKIYIVINTKGISVKMGTPRYFRLKRKEFRQVKAMVYQVMGIEPRERVRQNERAR